MVVWWHVLGEVENECISHNFSLFAMFLPTIIKIVENLMKFWQIWTVSWDMVYKVIRVVCTDSELVHRLVESAEVAVVLGSLDIVLTERPHC